MKLFSAAPEMKASYRSGLILAISGLLAAAAPMHAVAHTAVGGTGGVGNVTITDSVLYTPIRQVTVNFTGEAVDHNCAVSAGGQVFNPSTTPVRNLYSFLTSLDTLSPPENSQDTRILELTNNLSPVLDARQVHVATARTFFNVPPGIHTIYFLGKKHSTTPAAPDLVVSASSLTIVCATNFGF